MTDDQVYINWRLPRDVHTSAKIAAAQQGVTLKSFVTEAVRKAANDSQVNWPGKEHQK